MLGTFWAPLVAAGGTAAALWGVMQVLSSPWPTILVGAVVGGIVYLALLWLVARDALEYLIGKVIPSRAVGPRLAVHPEGRGDHGRPR